MRHTQHSGARSAESIGYHFLAFKRRIESIPPSQIRSTAQDYQDLIAEDFSHEAVDPNVEVQCILNFLEFLDSNVIPGGLSKRERGFYGRTIERMVGNRLLPKAVLEEFNRNYSQDFPRHTTDFQTLRAGCKKMSGLRKRNHENIHS